MLLLALPPFYVLPLAFVALVPLGLAVERLPDGFGGSRAAALLGLLFGLFFWSISLAWIPAVVGSVFGWAYPGYLLLVASLGALSAVFTSLFHRIRRWARLPVALALPLSWVAVEWARSHLPLGLAFPWLGLGVTLTRWPRLLGTAEWLGESGIAFWLAAVNGAVVAWAVRRGRREGTPFAGGPGGGSPRTGPLFRVGGIGLLVVLPAAIGWWGSARAIATAAPDLRVAAVGTGVPRDLRSDAEGWVAMAMDQVSSALGSAHGKGRLDLLVLPEGTVPLPQGAPGAQSHFARVGRWAREQGVPVVVGGQGASPQPGDTGKVTNSLFLVGGGGSFLDRYDKIRLVPVMEQGRYAQGRGPPLLKTERFALGPLICYESLFGDQARSARRQGAQVLVNPTNDIWFGGGDSWVGRFFLPQHPAHLVLRAVENRMAAVRSANGGYTLVLGPDGRAASPILEPGKVGLVQAEVPLRSALTFYTRVGDVLGLVSAVAVAALLVLRRRPRRSSGASGLRRT